MAENIKPESSATTEKPLEGILTTPASWEALHLPPDADTEEEVTEEEVTNYMHGWPLHAITLG